MNNFEINKTGVVINPPKPIKFIFLLDKNTKDIFRLSQPYSFNYAEKKIRKFALNLGYSKKIQDLHLLVHLKRILPYNSMNKMLKQYITGYIYFILFEKY